VAGAGWSVLRTPSVTEQSSTGSSKNQISETIDVVTAYVRQETIGPLRNVGRWVAFGIAGVLVLSLGLSLMLLGLLRLLQTEAASTFDGNWSWAPYAITLVACGVIAAIAMSRIRKQTLDRKEPRR
jgi:hypothetical protein